MERRANSDSKGWRERPWTVRCLPPWLVMGESVRVGHVELETGHNCAAVDFGRGRRTLLGSVQERGRACRLAAGVAARQAR
jgi:hypothetical protein